MAASDSKTSTQLLAEATAGNSAAVARLLPQVYDELHRIAQSYFRSESKAHTLQPTALVHEAYMKLIDQNQTDWQGRTHFLAVGAQAMRRILVDHARTKQRVKRGGRHNRIALDEHLVLASVDHDDLTSLDDALQELAKLDARQAHIVELRFFGGLSVAEVAEVLGVSQRTIGNEWRMAKAWLRRALHEDSSP